MVISQETFSTEKSERVHKAASRLIPETSAGPGSSSPGCVAPVIVKGKGATVTDVDGNE